MSSQQLFMGRARVHKVHYHGHAVNRERTLERLGKMRATLRLHVSDQRNRDIDYFLSNGGKQITY